MAVIAFEPGGYRYIEGVFQYSAGLAAQPGFAIHRARLRRAVPLAEGFAGVEKHLAAIGRPIAAFCACELRSPAPFTEDGFTAFNRAYVEVLERWGIVRDGVNPVARTNVCPLYGAPPEPSLSAFSYTVPSDGDGGGFVVAGSGEAKEGSGSYRSTIVRLGETTSEAMLEKVRAVRAEMERRLSALGAGWDDAGIVHAYTAHDIGWLVAAEFARAGAVPHGLTWQIARPPVVDIEFEMDVLGPVRSMVL